MNALLIGITLFGQLLDLFERYYRISVSCPRTHRLRPHRGLRIKQLTLGL